MKKLQSLIIYLCLISLTACSTTVTAPMPVTATPNEVAAWKLQVYEACKANKKEKELTFRDNKARLSFSTVGYDNEPFWLESINALLSLGTLGLYPWCRELKVVSNVNLKDNFSHREIGTYTGHTFGCYGWLVWSRTHKYGEGCEDLAERVSTNILYDLYDQEVFK